MVVKKWLPFKQVLFPWLKQLFYLSQPWLRLMSMRKWIIMSNKHTFWIHNSHNIHTLWIHMHTLWLYNTHKLWSYNMDIFICCHLLMKTKFMYFTKCLLLACNIYSKKCCFYIHPHHFTTFFMTVSVKNWISFVINLNRNSKIVPIFYFGYQEADPHFNLQS